MYLQAISEHQVRVDNALICKVNHCSSYLYSQLQRQFSSEWLHTMKQMHTHSCTCMCTSWSLYMCIHLWWSDVEFNSDPHLAHLSRNEVHPHPHMLVRLTGSTLCSGSAATFMTLYMSPYCTMGYTTRGTALSSTLTRSTGTMCLCWIPFIRVAASKNRTTSSRLLPSGNPGNSDSQLGNM